MKEFRERIEVKVYSMVSTVTRLSQKGLWPMIKLFLALCVVIAFPPSVSAADPRDRALVERMQQVFVEVADRKSVV